MSSLFFPSHTFTLKRRRRIGSSDRFAVSATYSAIPADVQPADRERTDFFGGRFGQIYSGFFDISVDLKEGDMLVDATGRKFAVKGVQRWAGAGLLDHWEAALSLINE
jgi:hypothetical protein